MPDAPAPPPAPPSAPWHGACHLLFQYDVGQGIDLEHCKHLIAAQPARIRQEHRAPAWFQFNPPPLQCIQHGQSLAVGALSTEPQVGLILYDFGAVSVSYRLPFRGTLEDLARLSAHLQESTQLWEQSLQQVQQLMDLIRPAVSKPGLADATEDYLIFHLEPPEGGPPLAELPRTHPRELVQILRGEREPLAQEEIHEALGSRVSYGPDDLVLVDWQAALLIGRGLADAHAVLEFASVQLLEMRFLDHKLDEALDRSYEALTRKLRPWPASSSKEMLRVARLQVDASILFERVTNALKLLGDQYLARVYQLTSRQFRLKEWNEALSRKLETVDSIYQKLNDRAEARRMELLEWIIILLFVVSLVLPFFSR